MVTSAAREPSCTLNTGAQGQVLCLHGDWTLRRLPRLEADLKTLDIDPLRPLLLDAGKLDTLDSAGAKGNPSRTCPWSVSANRGSPSSI